MSLDLIVFLRRSTMPTAAQWQQAVHEAGFPVELGIDFDVDTLHGFLPCKFRGEDTGFEYDSTPLDEEGRVECGVPPGADFIVTLSAHSDLREVASSLVAAGVLCQVSGGLLVDPQSGEAYSPERALEWVGKQLSELDTRLDRDDVTTIS